MAVEHLHTALLDICDELLLHIFAYLDIPELLACSRTSHRLPPPLADPTQHAHRLHAASSTLSHHLPHSPPLASLRPPLSSIYLTPTHVAARKVRWSMLRVGLGCRLARRLSVASW